MSEFPQEDIINNYSFLECVSILSCWLKIQETANVDVKRERDCFEEQLKDLMDLSIPILSRLLKIWCQVRRL